MSLSNEERTRPTPSPTLPTVTQMLPPLPTISSAQLLRRVFTHSSMSVGPRNGFETPHADPMRDNEGLAHIGDGVLGLAVTDLIQGRYPRLHVGPTSAVQKVRDRIKYGGTLAKITVQYRLHERLRSEDPYLRDAPRVQVNLFKAYVGGLFKEQGVDVVKRWLDPLFEPFVDVAYRAERRHHLSLEPTAPATPSPTPSISPPPRWIAPASSPPGRAAGSLKRVDVKGGSEATTARNIPPLQRLSPAAAGASPGATDGLRDQHTRRGIGSRDGGRGDAGAPDLSYVGRYSGSAKGSATKVAAKVLGLDMKDGKM
ncbi:ribonuclease III domain-containing protein [Lactarius deliciosus]|nr:ribonuclease III domain-containing protein [Lactarius deliciosus]